MGHGASVLGGPGRGDAVVLVAMQTAVGGYHGVVGRGPARDPIVTGIIPAYLCDSVARLKIDDAARADRSTTDLHGYTLWVHRQRHKA
jgi:hypothetical protein